MEPETAPTSDRTPALKGRLAELPLADILQFIQVGSRTGALFLSGDEGQTAILTFRGGNLVQAISTDYYQTLADRLIARKLIAEQDSQEALAYLAKFPGLRIGDALVEKGLLTRQQVEDEVRAQTTETMDHLLTWQDAEFEFRSGVVSLGRGLPEFAANLREGPPSAAPSPELLGDETRPIRAPSPATPQAPEPPKEIRWFDSEIEQLMDSPETDHPALAEAYESLSEELLSVRERGEMGLLLLRFASELFEAGGLLLCVKGGFRVLGQFGSAFFWGPGPAPAPQAFFAAGESPLFDSIAESGKTVSGFVGLTPDGFPRASEPKEPGATAALVVPLKVLGQVSLILFCRSAIGSHDARSLIALARQVSETIENLARREIAKRKMASEAGGQ